MTSSSLSNKLESDALLVECRTHVQELHALFVSWFQGKRDRQELTDDLNHRLAPSFSHVAPNGQFIRGSQVLVNHLLQKYGVYKDRVFDIAIYNVRLLWSNSKHCLVTYEEWQSWKQNGEDIQFGRLSTCLLEKISTGMQWIHVHETWLEAESPPTSSDAGKSLHGVDADAESVETGPVAQDKSAAVAAATNGSTSNGTSSNYKLLYFMSSATLNQQQLIHQNLANSRLKALKLDYETVDAGDVTQKDVRAQLFEISGQRAVYPLFFLRNYENIVYWGNWEQFLKAVYANKLTESLENGTPAPPLPVEVEDDEESDDEGPVEAPATSVFSDAAAAIGGAAAAVGGAVAAAVSRLSPVPHSEEPAEVEAEKEAPKPVAASAPAPAPVAAPAPAPAPVATKPTPTPLPPITHEPGESAVLSQSYVKRMSSSGKNSGKLFAPREVSSKRHVSPLIQQYAKPLTWENALVGISVAGFDIGTSQGPIADEAWYKQHGAQLEDMAQSRSIPRPRRKICLPEMVFPTAHVAMEGHGVWFSWDCSDALEAWAKAHHEIAIHSRISHNGVSVMRARDAKLWDSKRKHGAGENDKVSSVFHYDWTYSTPFTGKHEGGKWKELSESGMNVGLLTDTTVPILFFDEIILFEDDMHDNGQVQYSVKLRVMPTCSYVLARLWVRVDNIILRVRETRILFAFGASGKPEIYRDVAWRECMWNSLADHKLPTDVKAWRHEGPETPAWSGLLKSLPEVALPRTMPKFAEYEYDEVKE
ncbi:hypothetical protein MPSEU_001105900 [Mayamaea pseudoterrestris]|nr:hypothetical protein MPSEU_001105900 [Mayamaea pseudoterrestris]